MEGSSSEMSAEEMTEAMSLEEKPEASNSAVKFGGTSSSENSKTVILQEKPGDREPASLGDNADQAASAENIDEANAAKPEEANARSVNKFTMKDPLSLVPYIEKYVTIQLERNYSFVGFIHSIDPITHSVILSVPKDGGRYQTVIIPGTSILDITEAPLDSTIVPPKRKQTRELLSDDIKLRKKKIISWLKDNLLTVSEEGENIIFGTTPHFVTLLPPYEENDISTTNPLIASEIQKMIAKMPADYQPK